MRQLVYFSTAVGPQSETMLEDILASSRRWNEINRVTGLLIAGGQRFLQVIEAERDPLRLTIERIMRDRRHRRVDILVQRSIVERSFADWSMAFFADPALDDYATFSDVVGVLRATVDEKLRDQVDAFHATFRASPLAPPTSWTLAD